MIKNKIKMSMAVVLVVGLVSGCSNPADPVTGSISGNVVDGYVSNATVCADLNNNSLCDTNEKSTKTDSNGGYTLDISSLNEAEKNKAKIIVFGGIDNSTGKEFQGMLKGLLIPNEEEINLNALTTMAALKTNDNKQALVKLEEVATTCGVTKEDIMDDILNSQNKTAYQEALKLQKVMENLNVIDNIDTLNKIMEKMSVNFDGNFKSIETIVDNTTFDGDLAEIEKIKLNAKSIIQSLNINDDDTMEEISNKQVQLEAKRDILKSEINKYKLMDLDLSDLDETVLSGKYTEVENTYSIENLKEVKMLNEWGLEEDLIRNQTFLSVFKELNITKDTKIKDVIDLINNTNLLTVEQKDIIVPILTYSQADSEIDVDDDDLKEVAKKLIRLHLFGLAKDLEVLNSLKDQEINYVNYEEVIALTDLSVENKVKLIEALQTKYSYQLLQYAQLANDIFGTTLSQESIISLIASFELNLDEDEKDMMEMLKDSISDSATLTDLEKTTYKNLLNEYILSIVSTTSI